MKTIYKAHSREGEYIYPLLVAFKSSSFTPEERRRLKWQASRGDSPIMTTESRLGGGHVLVVYDYYIAAHATLREMINHTLRIIRVAILGYFNISTVKVIVWFER
ncbi:MAG: hypothetical protein ACRCZM_11655 [Bacteroidales bacterium]